MKIVIIQNPPRGARGNWVGLKLPIYQTVKPGEDAQAPQGGWKVDACTIGPIAAQAKRGELYQNWLSNAPLRQTILDSGDIPLLLIPKDCAEEILGEA